MIEGNSNLGKNFFWKSFYQTSRVSDRTLGASWGMEEVFAGRVGMRAYTQARTHASTHTTHTRRHARKARRWREKETQRVKPACLAFPFQFRGWKEENEKTGGWWRIFLQGRREDVGKVPPSGNVHFTGMATRWCSDCAWCALGAGESPEERIKALQTSSFLVFSRGAQALGREQMWKGAREFDVFPNIIFCVWERRNPVYCHTCLSNLRDG